MAKRRKASKARKASRKAAKPKDMYMCVHCGYKSSKSGMHCGTMCEKC
ncbi:MAG: hypothetical protein HYW26_01555 [Candidatus Aenigmarchaeota archaeon]|nr:hypothetical protein [Candidatus Aenigmarchaeota archaeon]